MGAVNWNNVSYIMKPFTKKNDSTNYGAVPNWKKMGGYIPGTQPSAGKTVAPSPITDQMRQAIENLPDVFTIFHG